ncbi:hypothetical protein QFC21_001076 [Naganishia friedmannii]|uniref:Uncharacterized protein n=1 Tax=Naganishia friedmannii TaxID=89922 RepID=A0ACC2W7J9_9TREE|nr:hypothetical protein QFC21_001076 [Naganishia friedmannii]
MSRSTSMPAFTSREVEANAAKDADLGLSRGDSFVWMDDNSRKSDQQEDFALITPPEPQASSSGGFAVAQAEFFGNNWQQRDRPLFANPFDNMIPSKPAPRDEISQAPHETSPGRYDVPELRLPDESNDPPSPTRRRPSLPRYRSSPELHHISSDGMNDSSRAGLNIVFSTSDGSLGDAWTRLAAGPSSSTDSALRSPPPMHGCATLMRRSIEDTEQTLVNLLPRLSTNSQSFGAGMKRPSLTYGDPSEGPATGMKRQSLTSRRGSWAQASFIDFSPPPITLGREYRSRFNSVDSAMTRNSDAGSLFGSFSGSDWMKPYDTKKEEWARRSADFSSIGIRRGSDTNARRRSSLMRTAYVNSSLNRLGSMNVSSVAPSETQFYDSTYRETANPGPTRGFRFGSAISNLSGIVSPEKTVREEDEGAEGQEWQTRRGSWCEV